MGIANAKILGRTFLWASQKQLHLIALPSLTLRDVSTDYLPTMPEVAPADKQ